jgi:hypothetical protein
MGEVYLAEDTSNLPVELVRIVDRCLKKDQSARYQSARDLLTDLESLGKTISQSQPRNILRPQSLSCHSSI